MSAHIQTAPKVSAETIAAAGIKLAEGAAAIKEAAQLLGTYEQAKAGLIDSLGRAAFAVCRRLAPSDAMRILTAVQTALMLRMGKEAEHE